MTSESCGIPDICSMLRNSIFILLAALGLTLLANSCRKPDDVTHSVYSSEDQAIGQILFTDIVKVMDNVVNDIDGLRGDDCVDALTIDTTGLPLTLLIDYGADHCESLDGRFRTGQLFAEFSGKYNEEGTQVTITPNGYQVDDYSINGQVTLTNLPQNFSGNRERSLVVTSGQIKAPENLFTISWECDQVLEFVEGDISWFVIDDVHSITGTCSGTNRNATDYDAEITSPLLLDAVCRWFPSGKLDILPAGRGARELDFGLDNCNDLATVLVEGKSYTIVLP